MSMGYYPVDDYGLVLDEEAIVCIVSKEFEDFDENEDFDWGYELYDAGICEYIGEFSGEARQLRDTGIIDWDKIKYYHDCEIVYVPMSCYPTIFKSAYNNMDEIVREFKSKLGKYLPNDFDYRSRICHISGTYFG